MSQYYLESENRIISESEIRSLFPNKSLPSVLTGDTLLSLGIKPVLAAPQPTPTELQTVFLAGIKADALGNIVQDWQVRDMFSGDDKAAQEAAYLASKLEGLKNSKIQAIEAKRTEKEKAGCTYTFPDATGVIQTRNDVDVRNVQAVTTTALILSNQGITDPVIPFRDQGDVIHLLTPTQAIMMGMAVQTFISATYAWSWGKKAAVMAAVVADQVNEISLED